MLRGESTLSYYATFIFHKFMNPHEKHENLRCSEIFDVLQLLFPSYWNIQELTACFSCVHTFTIPDDL